MVAGRGTGDLSWLVLRTPSTALAQRRRRRQSLASDVATDRLATRKEMDASNRDYRLRWHHWGLEPRRPWLARVILGTRRPFCRRRHHLAHPPYRRRSAKT